MISLANVIYYLVVAIWSTCMSYMGYGWRTWQFWVTMFCMISANVLGQMVGRGL